MATRYEILGCKARGRDTVVTLQALDTCDGSVIGKPVLLPIGTVLADHLGTLFKVLAVEGECLVVRGRYRPSGGFFYPNPDMPDQ